MSHKTIVETGFEGAAEEIVERLRDVVTHDHYEGEVEYETYQETDSPIDVEATITGAWADLTAVAVVVQQSEYFTVSTFALSDDGRGHVVLGLRFHPDVEGLFEYQSY